MDGILLNVFMPVFNKDFFITYVIHVLIFAPYLQKVQTLVHGVFHFTRTTGLTIFCGHRFMNLIFFFCQSSKRMKYCTLL